MHGKEKVYGSNSVTGLQEVFTFQWGLFSRLGLTFRPAGSLWSPCRGLRARGGAWSAGLSCVRACFAWLWRLSWLVVAGAGLVVVAVAGQGGPAASPARVLRRRLRVFGGSPAAARRWVSSCRAFQAARMRWLRTTSSTVVNSIRGAGPIRRHQPRVMSLVAGSLAVAKPRSAPVRRA